MSKRTNISSGAPWEDIVGYSRAVRINNTIEVSGTAPVKGGKTFAPGNAYEQAKCCIEIIEVALKQAGADLARCCKNKNVRY